MQGGQPRILLHWNTQKGAGSRSQTSSTTDTDQDGYWRSRTPSTGIPHQSGYSQPLSTSRSVPTLFSPPDLASLPPIFPHSRLNSSHSLYSIRHTQQISHSQTPSPENSYQTGRAQSPSTSLHTIASIDHPEPTSLSPIPPHSRLSSVYYTHSTGDFQRTNHSRAPSIWNTPQSDYSQSPSINPSAQISFGHTAGRAPLSPLSIHSIPDSIYLLRTSSSYLSAELSDLSDVRHSRSNGSAGSVSFGTSTNSA